MPRGAKIVDLTGRRIGRLTILGLSHRVTRSTTNRIGGTLLYWKYRCDCGNEGAASGANLKRGMTQSCGCLHKERFTSRTHGMRRHPAYSTWCAIKNRTKNESHIGYGDYGGRGVKVCSRWDSFNNFWEDMGPSWFDGGTIERIDVNGDYGPSNCTWIAAEEQAGNKRNSLKIETPWGRMSVSEAATKSGLPYEVIRVRWHQGKVGDELFEPTQREIPTVKR